MARRHRVIIWGTGLIGQYALRHILRRPEFELVGVKCHSPSKEGRDAAELADGDHPPTGVKATRDGAAVIALDADIVIFAPFDPMTDPSIEDGPSSIWVPDLLALLRSGKNVVTTLVPLVHWRQMRNSEDFRRKLEAACLEGQSSFFMNGIDPGLVTDTLAYGMAALSSDVTEINSWEILDYGSYMGLDVVKYLGFGSPPDGPSATDPEMLGHNWGGFAYLLADVFGVELDGIRVHIDVALAQQPFTTESGLFIDRGTIEGISWKVAGHRQGRDLFAVNHVTRMGPKAAPGFRNIGHDGGYGIEITGFPPLRAEFPFGLPGSTGRGWLDAMAISSFRLVNAADTVIAAQPGWRFFHELHALGGRYSLKAV